MKTNFLFLFLVVLFFSACQNQQKEAPFIELVKSENKVDVVVDGKIFTTYQWPEGVFKPVLVPIFTLSGTEITRGFPLNPKPGERSDHIHQVGNWLNYGNVNGSDFWGNGHSGERSPNGGEIKLQSIDQLISGKGEALLSSTSMWLDSTNTAILEEKTELRFIVSDSLQIIDRKTTLSALNNTVEMPDTKEGMFAIRVARELELPASGRATIIGEKGEIVQVDSVSNENISGNYKSSEGISGLEVWGTRAKWMHLFGQINHEKISIVICDHPENINYPTYWHARGYGLFSANPLGEKDFTNGEKQLNLSLNPKEKIVFRYRIIISSNHHLTNDEINILDKEFETKQ